MKTKEELKQIKEAYTELNKKLAELTDEELVQVIGGRAGYTSCDFRFDSRIEKCPNGESYQMWDYHMCYNCEKRTVENIPRREID